MCRVIYDGLRTCNLNFFFAFSCDRTISPGIGIFRKEDNNTFVLPHYRRHIFVLRFPGLARFQFQDSWFPKFCWPIFSICPCNATAARFLFQKHFHKICGADKIVEINMMPFSPEIFCKLQYSLFPLVEGLVVEFLFFLYKCHILEDNHWHCQLHPKP